MHSVIKHTFLILLSINLNLPQTTAQRIVVTGQAEVLMTDPDNQFFYEYEAKKAAIENAVNSRFGTSISTNYERLTMTEIDGRSVISHTDIRNNYMNSFPNARWLGDKEEPVYNQYKDVKGNWWMKCTVTGFAEEIKSAEVEFSALTLDGTDYKKDETIQFIEGENGYIYFKSAEDGYLMIFYDDMATIQRCLPYNAMKETLFKIDANRDYIFFSPEHADYIKNNYIVDEIEFFTESELEYNQFYFLFSPDPFKTPVLDAEKELEDGYYTFKWLKRDEFKEWLQKCRIRYPDLQVQIIGITIKNSD
jgi:hypothetical protein